MDEIRDFLNKKLSSPLDVPPAKVAKLPSGDMEYVTFGEGKPLLIIHAGGGGFDQALLLFKRYVPEGFQMICPSRPGYLGTPLATGQTVEQQVDALAGLLDHLHVPSAVIVTLSAGGTFLYPFALRHPQKTKAIVAIDAISGEYLMPEQAGKLAQAFFMTEIGLWLTKKSTVYFPEAVVKNLFQTEGYLDPARLEARVKEVISSREHLEIIADLVYCLADFKNRQAGVANDMALGAKSQWYDFARITCPALIIHGTHDADVKFFNGVFAYERLGSKDKVRFWIEFGTHFGFFFAPDSPLAQQKFREFLLKHG